MIRVHVVPEKNIKIAVEIRNRKMETGVDINGRFDYFGRHFCDRLCSSCIYHQRKKTRRTVHWLFGEYLSAQRKRVWTPGNGIE